MPAVPNFTGVEVPAEETIIPHLVRDVIFLASIPSDVTYLELVIHASVP